MSQRTIPPRTYVVVCALLVLLTVLTVAVSFLRLSTAWHFAFGLAIAACKAALVVLFFMHALVSDRLTWAVIAVVGFWVVVLFVLTFADYLSRGLVPFMPGH